MKNKKLKYILIPLVLVVWGVVLIRIFSYLRPSDSEIILPQKQAVKSKQKKQDSFTLLLNYPDPFANQRTTYSSRVQSPYESENISYYEEQHNTVPNQRMNTRNKQGNNSTPAAGQKNSQKEEFRVLYFGMVNNSSPDCRTAYILYDGSYFLCRPGDSINQMVIKSFNPDELTFYTQDSTYRIKKTDNE